jgi:hypothetical protein
MNSNMSSSVREVVSGVPSSHQHLLSQLEQPALCAYQRLARVLSTHEAALNFTCVEMQRADMPPHVSAGGWAQKGGEGG